MGDQSPDHPCEFCSKADGPYVSDGETDHNWLLSSETNLNHACASVVQSTNTLNSSEQGSIASFVDIPVKTKRKSTVTLDRLSYICSHQGPNVVASPNTRCQSYGSMSTGSYISMHAPLAKWDSCSTARTNEQLCSSHLLLDSVETAIRESDSFQGDSQSICLGFPGSYSKLNESCCLMCRICHCGDEEEPLMVTCHCTGTVKYAHQNCVLNWISKSGNQYCELCKFKFKTKRKKIKSLWKWQFPSVSTKGWLHIGLFVAFITMLLTSITWIVWSRVSSTPTAVAERTTDEVKFAYMLNGLFIALAIGGLYFDSYRHVRRYFQRWSVLNRHMIIEPYSEHQTAKNEKKESETDSTVVATCIEQCRGSEASMAVEITEGEGTSKGNSTKNKSGKGTWV